MPTQTRKDTEEGDPIVYRILDAVAEARDEDITSLPPIGDVLDPDALEQFVASTAVPTEISLEIYGCSIVIDADGNVAVASHDHSA